MSRRPPRRRIQHSRAWSRSRLTHLDIRVRFIKDPNVTALQRSSLKKTIVRDLSFPRSLKEPEFLDLLRSSFPPLAGSHKLFEIYTLNRSTKLQKLPLKTMTPNEIIRSIKANAPRATVLFIKLKSPGAEKTSEETPEEKLEGASEEIQEKSEEDLEENDEEIEDSFVSRFKDKPSSCVASAEEEDEAGPSSRSTSHRPPRCTARPSRAWTSSSPTHLNLRIRFMKDPNMNGFQKSFLKNTLVRDLNFPRNLPESKFVDLLRSSFPPLAGSHKAFEIHTLNRNKKLQELPLKTMTPREIIRSIKANAPRATVLFIKLKKTEAEKKSEETSEETLEGASEEIKEKYGENLENIEESLEENTEDTLEENPEENPKENIEDNLAENIEENPKKNTEENLAENIEENPKENTEENLKENIEDNVEENTEEHLEEDTEDIEDSHVSTVKEKPSSCDADAEEDEAGPSSSSGPHGVREEAGFNDSTEHHKDSEVDIVDQDDASAEDPEWRLESKRQKVVKKTAKKSQEKRWKKRACKVCGFWYRSLGTLIKHAWTHMNEPQRVCGVCGDTFESTEELQEHLRTYDEVYKCEECGKTFVGIFRFKRHLVMHSENVDIRCDVCGKNFGTKATLNLHSWSHKEERPHKCELCEKSFGLKSLLKAHRRSHENKCHLCNKSLSTTRSLSRHLMSHSEKRHFVCEVCGKRFKIPQDLKMHKKVHMTRERSFLCDICCKAFYCNATLKAHLKTHSSERPFVCQDCGKSFVSKGNLKIHQRVHTGETPYICSHCGQRFKRKQTLDSHISTHLGIKPFTCSVCGKASSTHDHLKVHMRTHTGDRPYKCSLCDKTFTQSHCLKTHMMKNHAGENQNQTGP
ncbi:zinc finger protein 595 [Oryzias melastigma]|uniref:zinc finger protein 595 n=1 Tax=Oryzias melastigma TaxID=30732 RepID=UPI00168D0987|nr:zinc finger protein 595 [Oryzias melastigma]